ncbi:MAG: hypothetical protein ACI8PZ_002607 [Myxococcota bacterium]|jgi:hypothetical protein
MLAGGAALLVGCTCGRSADPVLERGVSALWALQAEDGGWHSRTYGFLAPGETLTAFALATLARVPDLAPAAGLSRALSFLTERGRDGSLGLGGLASEYPTYATGLGLGCLARAGVEPAVQAAMRAWLLGQQRLGAQWGPADGGFPMGSAAAPPVPPAHPGHVDLSMTRRAIEGLCAGGWSGPARDGALRYVRRSQRSDGSFVYSAVEDALNKGGRGDDGPQGYGSATADGVLAALALGERALAESGANALRQMHRLDGNPRLGQQHQGFVPAMRGYYLAGAAAVFAALGGPPGWAEALGEAVRAGQGADGLWRNPVTLQKEDDPLIASPLALSALLDAASA